MRWGILYLVTAFVSLMFGGVQALVMRLLLVGPDAHILRPEQYNELFSMQGITMIFWYAFPVLSSLPIISGLCCSVCAICVAAA